MLLLTLRFCYRSVRIGIGFGAHCGFSVFGDHCALVSMSQFDREVEAWCLVIWNGLIECHLFVLLGKQHIAAAALIHYR